jgi:1-deoxy-D-xylulose-5-phosphate synthase
VFDRLGLAYVGPVDGHDIPALETAFRHAATLDRPVVVHCVTEKGKGWRPAEIDEADRMHGIGVLNATTGKPVMPDRRSWTSVFGDELVRIAAGRDDVVAITGAMLQPVGLKKFAAAYPDRVFDVVIAEQAAVCSAAGLAMAGLHPVVAIYATFLNRAVDQALMEVALHALPVTFVLDRAGITGPDGASHHGIQDLSLLAMIPGLEIAAPRDPARLGELLAEAVDRNGPTVVRFPKASVGPDLPAMSRMEGIDVLHRTAYKPMDVLFIAIGSMAGRCLDAARILELSGIGVTVVDPRWLLPVNPALVNIAARHRLTVTVEDGIISGGVGAALDQAIPQPVRTLGLPTAFLGHGDRDDLLAQVGLDSRGIAAAAHEFFQSLSAVQPVAAMDGLCG